MLWCYRLTKISRILCSIWHHLPQHSNHSTWFGIHGSVLNLSSRSFRVKCDNCLFFSHSCLCGVPKVLLLVSSFHHVYSSQYSHLFSFRKPSSSPILFATLPRFHLLNISLSLTKYLHCPNPAIPMFVNFAVSAPILIPKHSTVATSKLDYCHSLYYT